MEKDLSSVGLGTVGNENLQIEKISGREEKI